VLHLGGNDLAKVSIRGGSDPYLQSVCVGHSIRLLPKDLTTCMAHAYCDAMQAILVVIEGDIVTLSVLGCAGYILTPSSRKVPCALRALQVAA